MRHAALVVAASLLLGCSFAPAPELREEPVHFKNADVTLAGSLFLPGGQRRHPAVVIFHGSGPQERDRFMGRWFAEQGIACLTYDKRGVGESTGDFRTIPFLKLVDDGLSAVAFLKARDDIDPKKIGVWGLSQGGWLGPLAASQSKDIAFVIAVSGPGVSPGEQMIFYWGERLRYNGLSDQQVAAASDLRRMVWHSMSKGVGLPETMHALERARGQSWFAALQEQDSLFGTTSAEKLRDAASRSNWYKYEMNYDPLPTLRKLSVPALFVFGERDDLVPVPKSVELIRQTLIASGHHDFTIRTFPGADHGIRLDDRQLAPGYLTTMHDWLRDRKFLD